MGLSQVSATGTPHSDVHHNVMHLFIVRGVLERKVRSFLGRFPRLQAAIAWVFPAFALPDNVVLKKEKPNWEEEYDNENAMYKQLHSLQGRTIPRFYGEAVVDGARAMVLSRIEGIYPFEQPIPPLPADDFMKLGEEALSEINAFGLSYDDIKLDNFLLVQGRIGSSSAWTMDMKSGLAPSVTRMPCNIFPSMAVEAKESSTVTWPYLTMRAFRTPVRIPEMVKDEQGRYWTPTFPPGAARDIGPIFGQREFAPEGRRVVHHIPSSEATVSWLDCSRPIESIKVALCHGTNSSQLPLVSLSLKYSDDQTTSSIGPTKFSLPRDTHGRNGNYWCWCAEGSRHDEEFQERPHYTEDNWNAEGSLKSVQLWVGDDGVLTGLQFITQDGKTSPAWGYCVGEKPIKLPLQAQKKNRAAGLKVFIDRINRDVLREDYVAIQLIGFSKI
ncbi:hypothetical protein LCI18_013775 [Fusarium solani-melongenae]|uniref:Uncharacterized protein n=1 Tax=Fusarium solani subsp. cucurbitae TaxID=2747967 RepID=A0ACD3ZNN3_FUSSC|nr:hypothetical protein LCI18_013775 [Fusarium solani-melongenae]